LKTYQSAHGRTLSVALLRDARTLQQTLIAISLAIFAANWFVILRAGTGTLSVALLSNARALQQTLIAIRLAIFAAYWFVNLRAGTGTLSVALLSNARTLQFTGIAICLTIVAAYWVVESGAETILWRDPGQGTCTIQYTVTAICTMFAASPRLSIAVQIQFSNALHRSSFLRLHNGFTGIVVCFPLLSHTGSSLVRQEKSGSEILARVPAYLAPVVIEKTFHKLF
jgi:hypothetical protein